MTKDIGHGNVMGGFPAVPVQDFRRQVAAIRRLSKRREHRMTEETVLNHPEILELIRIGPRF